MLDSTLPRGMSSRVVEVGKSIRGMLGKGVAGERQMFLSDATEQFWC